jgi:protein-disulfide isomerase/uncharacterized membrane protein
MTLTLDGWNTRRALLLAAAVLMMMAAAFTVQHYFAANYPISVFEGSFSDTGAFFNCDSAAYSSIAAVYGVPIGTFGLLLGGLFALAALFPSAALEHTGRGLALLNLVAVVALLLYSVILLRSMCLLCAGYYLGSLLVGWLFWNYRKGSLLRTSRPSLLHLATFGVVTIAGGYGMTQYHVAVRDAHGGAVASRAVNQYFSLPRVALPSRLSPFRSIRSTVRFEDAPIRIVEYSDPLCSDCRVLYYQLKELKDEFAGKINLAVQFFPLEAKCNDVVAKDLHPGACELSYILAYDNSKFQQLHDEVFENMRAARDSAWRADLARRHGVAAALTDPAVRRLVHQLMATGAEYEKTSDKYAHGIRSTPTMIINNRMVIGTLPTAHLRAIFRALVDEHELRGSQFLENWVDPGCVIPSDGGPPKACGPGGS